MRTIFEPSLFDKLKNTARTNESERDESETALDRCAVRESLNGRQVTAEEWAALFPNEACQTCPSTGCLWSLKAMERLEKMFSKQ
jgi:hypothetical protein